jgi:hypothetical protein
VTKSCLPTPPLGMGLTYLNNVETLLGHATNFFLSDSGGPLAQQLGVCWDTVDNHFFTQLAVASICVEALVGLSAATPVNHDRGFCSEDRIAISAWLDSHTRRLSTSFVNRVRGFIAALDHRRPVDVLRDWQREGILSVTDDDIRAWESIRHPAAHGRLQLDARSENEVQALLNAFHRVLNLINRIVLQLVGYEGAYVDYAQPGWPETPFLRTRPRC